MTTSRSPREVTAGERAADQAADTALPAPWLRASLPGARPGEWEQLLPKSRQSECYLRGTCQLAQANTCYFVEFIRLYSPAGPGDVPRLARCCRRPMPCDPRVNSPAHPRVNSPASISRTRDLFPPPRGRMPSMVTHPELDQRSLELHQLVAEKIRAEPIRFDRARATLARFRRIVDIRSQPYMIEWERVFEQGIEAALALATEDSERATALRQSSPFAGVLTDEERAEFFRKWFAEHGRQRAQD